MSILSRRKCHEAFYRTAEWFKVLQTAVMKLGPLQATGEKPEAHENSDQVLLYFRWPEITRTTPALRDSSGRGGKGYQGAE